MSKNLNIFKNNSFEKKNCANFQPCALHMHLWMAP